MALDTAFFQQDLFGCNNKMELFGMLQGGNWEVEDDDEFASLKFQESEDVNAVSGYSGIQLFNPIQEVYPTEAMPHVEDRIHSPLHLPQCDVLIDPNAEPGFNEIDLIAQSGRSRRRRPRSRKNKEELENQRMTHIAVERNRRKQMNDYLSILRSLMPESCVLRGDQASIIGGAINFVKELEQRLQLCSTSLKGNERVNDVVDHISSLPFSEFFNYPQFTTSYIIPAGAQRSSVADIEVTMAESHASIRIRSKSRPKQLLKIVSGLQFLNLSILHLNVTTKNQTVLYSLTVQLQEGCKLSSVNEIAGAVHQMVCSIHEEYQP